MGRVCLEEPCTLFGGWTGFAVAWALQIDWACVSPGLLADEGLGDWISKWRR